MDAGDRAYQGSQIVGAVDDRIIEAVAIAVVSEGRTLRVSRPARVVQAEADG